MEDPEGVLSFDFEGGLETGGLNPSGTSALISHDPAGAITGGSGSAVINNSDPVPGNLTVRRSFRQTVCRHWLRSLCMKGDACGFLHQYDKSRMPVCRFFRLYGECREQDCVYKHTNEDIKECNMYKLGFCPNGPDCRYRHAKLPGPPPPVDEIFQKLQQLSSFNFGSSNRFFHHRNASYTQQAEKIQFQQANQGVAAKPSTTVDSPSVQQQQPSQVQQPQAQASQNQGQNVTNGFANQVNRASTASPLPQGQSRYFIVKSCNRENLELSVQQGVWATQRSNEAKLNEAFDSSENVILIFSVNRTRHFQGCAKMTSKTGGFVGGGGWKYAHGTAHYGRNFSLKWLKLCELSFHKTRHLRNPYNENLPVKISRDCQELEASIGEQLVSLLYLEPDSELMAISVAAESKREEEKAKGVSPAEGAENPDIVPFEDNEEEEEEESDEEEETLSQALGMVQGRGRGRGAMWGPQMPLPRGARPLVGVKPMGFLPGMVGADGFGYGAIPTDGFTAMPDVFGRSFNPYGPRFSGDFSGLGQNSGMGFTPMDGTGPTSGMVFHGRPPQPGGVFPAGGFGGMMMGSSRGPFMGGLGMQPPGQARVSRPIGLPPFRLPLPMLGASRPAKRDQRRPPSDRNNGGDRYPLGLDLVKAPEMVGPTGGPDTEPKYPAGSKSQQAAFGAGNSYGNNDSESEDEAPRRSRHGEGKKKRRGSEGEPAGDHWE